MEIGSGQTTAAIHPLLAMNNKMKKRKHFVVLISKLAHATNA
ncbi:MAG: hypothetical protein ACTS8P_06525 [Arsenophonus sp. NC-XBC3-MAG3]